MNQSSLLSASGSATINGSTSGESKNASDRGSVKGTVSFSESHESRVGESLGGSITEGSRSVDGSSRSTATGVTDTSGSTSSESKDASSSSETAKDIGYETEAQRKRRLWTPLRRRVAVWKNDVDLIITARQCTPRWDIALPYVPVENGSLLRYARIEEEMFDHLVMQMKTGSFENHAERPDLELWVVGMGASLDSVEKAKKCLQDGIIFGKVSQEFLDRVQGGQAALQKAIDKATKKLAKATTASAKKEAKAALQKAEKAAQKAATKGARDKLMKDPPIDVTVGNGVEVVFDPARQTFYTSERTEDDLITLARNDYEKAFVVNNVVTRYGHEQLVFMNPQTQRLWRRFFREVVDPCLDDDDRLLSIRDRRKLAAKLFLERNTLKDVTTIEYPLTDSDEEMAAETKRQKELEKIQKKEAKAAAKEAEKEAEKAAKAAEKEAKAAALAGTKIRETSELPDFSHLRPNQWMAAYNNLLK